MLRVLAILVSVCGFAAAVPGAELPGRYGFERIDSGVLRVDRISGTVSLCTAREHVWSCKTIRGGSETHRPKEPVDAARTLNLPSDGDVNRLMRKVKTLVDRLLLFARS
jgi:hypothetical protein